LGRRIETVRAAVRIPLLPSENQQQAERYTEDDRKYVFAKPLLYKLALFVFVEYIKSHRVSPGGNIGLRVGTAGNAARNAPKTGARDA
jgi:hypothetical protein